MSLLTKKHILIMAGGTGGHVFPGLAVAQTLHDAGHEVSWLGTASGIESSLVPAKSIPLNIIDISGVRGKGKKGLLLAPFKICHAIWQSLIILKKIKPDCILGMGGFAAGPGGIAAKILGIPLLLHEQNAVAGTTNNILAPLSHKVLQAFPEAFAQGKKVETVGNPVRSTIKVQRKAYQKPLKVLVLGGSLGAKAINETIPLLIKKMQDDVQVWHQTGKSHINDVEALYKDQGLTLDSHSVYRLSAFIDDMAEAYAWADVIVCRSGAMTVSEVAVAAVPAIFIPYPFAIDDHQTANANWLVEAGAAKLLQQNDLSVELLSTWLYEFIEDPQILSVMHKNAQAVAIDNAAERVADYCLELAL